MNFWTTLWSIYAAISIFAITMTYKEQKRTKEVTPIFALIGYLTCTIWPLLVATILIMVQIAKRRNKWQKIHQKIL